MVTVAFVSMYVPGEIAHEPGIVLAPNDVVISANVTSQPVR